MAYSRRRGSSSSDSVASDCGGGGRAAASACGAPLSLSGRPKITAGAPPDDRRLPRPRPLLLRRGVGEVVEVRIRDCMAGARTTKVGDPGIGVYGPLAVAY